MVYLYAAPTLTVPDGVSATIGIVVAAVVMLLMLTVVMVVLITVAVLKQNTTGYGNTMVWVYCKVSIIEEIFLQSMNVQSVSPHLLLLILFMSHCQT